MDVDRMVVMAIGLVAATVPSSVPPEPPTIAERPALSGRWRINTEKSEDGGEKLRAAAAGRRPGGSGPGRNGGAGGLGDRGGRRGGGSGGAQGDPRDSMRAVIESPTEMTITHTETEIAVVEKDGRLRLLHPDGEPYMDSTGGRVNTRWEKDRLIVETKREDGPKVTEAFTLDSEPRQLVIDVRIESRFLDPVSVRRVYDPEAPG